MDTPEIIYTEQMLHKWGRWSVRKADVGLGFSKENSISRTMRLGAEGAAIRGDFRGGSIYIPKDIEQLDKLISTLKEKQKIALTYRYAMGLNDREAGKLLKIPLSTFSERRRNGLIKLSAMLMEAVA